MSSVLKYLVHRQIGLYGEGKKSSLKIRHVSTQQIYPSSVAAKRDLRGEVLLGFLQDGVHVVSHSTSTEDYQSYTHRLTLWETDFRSTFRRTRTFDLFEGQLHYMDLNIVSDPGLDRLIVFGCPHEFNTSPRLCHCAIVTNPIHWAGNECYYLTFSFELHPPYPNLLQLSALRQKEQIMINTGVSIVSIRFKQMPSSLLENDASKFIQELCEAETGIVTEIQTRDRTKVFTHEDIHVDTSSQSPTDTQHLKSIKIRSSKVENPRINQFLHVNSLDIESLIIPTLEAKIENFKALLNYDVEILDSIPDCSTVLLFLAVQVQRFDPKTPPISLFDRFFTYKECYMFKVFWRIFSEEIYLIGQLEQFHQSDHITDKPYWNPAPKLVLKHCKKERYISTAHNELGLYTISNRSMLTGNSLTGLINPRFPILLTL